MFKTKLTGTAINFDSLSHSCNYNSFLILNVKSKLSSLFKLNITNVVVFWYMLIMQKLE